MMKLLTSVAFLAILAAVPSANAQEGLIAVDVNIELNSTSPVTLFDITINVRNFRTIASFQLDVGVGGFGVPGATIVSFDDISDIADTPGAISIVGDNVLIGGVVPGFPFVDFIILLPNCVQGLNCADTSIFQPIIKFQVEVPQGTIADQIFVGTPDGVESPSFGFIDFGTVPVDLDAPTPAPTPVPAATPAPAPFDARSISDPHMYGFNGQKFQFHGEPGKIYNLISDSTVDLSVNALFAVAYTSGVTADTDTLVVSPYVAQGTWVKAVGIKVGASTLKVDTTEGVIRPCTTEGCFQNAAIEINGNPVMLLGRYADGDLVVGMSNSKSFSRVEVNSKILTAKVDIVAPPSMWNVPEQDVQEFTHINLIVQKVSLADGHGILGETISVRRDVNGNPVMESKGDNGEGILFSPPEDYEVQSLL